MTETKNENTIFKPMEKELNYTECLINTINDKLLELFFASQNKTEYEFFDFYEALRVFNDQFLKEAGREKYFKSIANKFRDVFKDLFFTESKTIWTEYISYNPESRILKLKIKTHITNKQGTEDNIIEQKIVDDWQHEYYKKNTENLNFPPIKPISINKYNYLLENCNKKETGSTINMEKKFNDKFDDLFNDYHLDIRLSTTFEGYVKRLQFEKELQTGKPLTVSKPKIITDLSGILSKITFEKRGIKRDRVEALLTSLHEKGMLTDSNDKDFTTIASIIYNTGWVVNIPTFSGWLKLFSKTCDRGKPTYNQTKVKDNIEKIKKACDLFDETKKSFYQFDDIVK